MSIGITDNYIYRLKYKVLLSIINQFLSISSHNSKKHEQTQNDIQIEASSNLLDIQEVIHFPELNWIFCP